VIFISNYPFGGGLSGSSAKTARRKALKFEQGKLFTFKKLDKPYVDFLSCLSTLKTKKVSSKKDACFSLQKSIFVLYDKKKDTWHGVDVKPDSKKK